jgi:hypothetical protein
MILRATELQRPQPRIRMVSGSVAILLLTTRFDHTGKGTSALLYEMLTGGGEERREVMIGQETK